jgi:hypothetical protein
MQPNEMDPGDIFLFQGQNNTSALVMAQGSIVLFTICFYATIGVAVWRHFS